MTKEEYWCWQDYSPDEYWREYGRPAPHWREVYLEIMLYDPKMAFYILWKTVTGKEFL